MHHWYWYQVGTWYQVLGLQQWYTMAGCNLKINIVGYVGLSIDFLLYLIIKSKKLWRIQKLMQILLYIYCPLLISPLKVYNIDQLLSFMNLILLLASCLVALLFAMIDCWHRLPCRKLCRNWGHSSVFWIVWQVSQDLNLEIQRSMLQLNNR